MNPDMWSDLKEQVDAAQDRYRRMQSMSTTTEAREVWRSRADAFAEAKAIIESLEDQDAFYGLG